MESKKNVNWGSHFGFIMTAAGFSIGLGNMWRFPYLVGTEGGGAFVLVYLLLAVLIGIPLFTMEMSLGRKTQQSPVPGVRSINGKGSLWNAFAWLGVGAAFFILTYYIQIMGWILEYILKSAIGALNNQTISQITQAFSSFRENWILVALLTLICTVLIGVISSQGLEKGVERACKIMMPALFVMLVLMIIRSLTLKGSWAGMEWYLTPDFSKITPQTFLRALGQVFFSIGIASGGALVYGSYLKKDSDILSDSLIIVGFDTFGALLSGAIIFPAIFAMGMEPSSGPGLLFITMSKIFAEMPFGWFFGVVFFVLVFFAAFSSALGYLEPVATTFRDVLHISRQKAVWASLLIIFIVGVPTILSAGPFKNVQLLGMNFFDLDDFFSGNILMPLGAIVLIFYVIFHWTFTRFKDDANIGAVNIKVADYWKPVVYFLIPIALLVIFVSGIYNVVK